MNTYIQKIIQHKKIVIALIAFLILFLASFHDAFYQKTIFQVTSVTNTYSSEKEGVNGQKEKCYLQDLTGIIKNGVYKGTTFSLSNEFSHSETLSIEYFKGDKIFVDVKNDSDGNIKIAPLYPKRDSFLFLFIGIFILLLFFLFEKQGFLTLLSAGINVLFFFFCLQFYESEAFFDWIWMVEILFFITITLLFVSGFQKKTFGAIISSLLTVVVVTFLFYVTIYTDNNIPYEMMPSYVPNLPLHKVFLISTIIGLLGAVMDISVTINSSVSEIITTTPEITLSALIKSIFAIGHDTMGTMVNVLFFSYLSGSFPLIVLKFSNNYTLDTLLTVDYIFDIIRFLIGSIGIVLAIPISGLISVLLFRKGLVKKQ